MGRKNKIKGRGGKMELGMNETKLVGQNEK